SRAGRLLFQLSPPVIGPRMARIICRTVDVDGEFRIANVVLDLAVARSTERQQVQRFKCQCRRGLDWLAMMNVRLPWFADQRRAAFATAPTMIMQYLLS